MGACSTSENFMSDCCSDTGSYRGTQTNKYDEPSTFHAFIQTEHCISDTEVGCTLIFGLLAMRHGFL